MEVKNYQIKFKKQLADGRIATYTANKEYTVKNNRPKFTIELKNEVIAKIALGNSKKLLCAELGLSYY